MTRHPDNCLPSCTLSLLSLAFKDSAQHVTDSLKPSLIHFSLLQSQADFTTFSTFTGHFVHTSGITPVLSYHIRMYCIHIVLLLSIHCGLLEKRGFFFLYPQPSFKVSRIEQLLQKYSQKKRKTGMVREEKRKAMFPN